MKNVEIYTSDTCIQCVKAKEYLKSEVSLDIDNIRTEAERFNLDKVIAIPIST